MIILEWIYYRNDDIIVPNDYIIRMMIFVIKGKIIL